jgi:prepilin-type processing-associated H-X9-DG protein
MPVAADKGPYFQAASDAHEDDTGAYPDERVEEAEPPLDWEDDEPTDVIKYSNEEWRPYNSGNHNGEGQNVLFADGHASFERKPICGVHHDNIFTATNGDYTEQINSLIGTVPADESAPALTPLTQTDSYLVP